MKIDLAFRKRKELVFLDDLVRGCVASAQAATFKENQTSRATLKEHLGLLYGACFPFGYLHGEIPLARWAAQQPSRIDVSTYERLKSRLVVLCPVGDLKRQADVVLGVRVIETR